MYYLHKYNTYSSRVNQQVYIHFEWDSITHFSHLQLKKTDHCPSLFYPFFFDRPRVGPPRTGYRISENGGSREQLSTKRLCILRPRGDDSPGRGGGYSVQKRVPTAVRPLESGACRDPQQLKKGAVLILYCRIGGLSETVQLIFHVK